MFLGPSSPLLGGGASGITTPLAYARDLYWVDLRSAPGGSGVEGSPFRTANQGLTAVPDGGTVMLVGGDASGESGITVNGKSHTVVGLGSGVAGAGLPPVLPTITYSTSVAQRLTYRNISVALVHSGATAGLTTVYFDKCPSATLTAGGDATTVYCSGDRSCSFSGSGGAGKFRGINLGVYTANGANPIDIDGCNVTGSQTSSTAVTITGGCTFGAGVSITAPSITIDPVSREFARQAGVTFAVTPTVEVTWGSPVDIDTTSADGTAQTFARSDHKHRLTFGVVAAVLALATSAINVNGQRITGGATPISSTDYVTKGYADGLAVGLKVKTAAVVVATSNQATLSGLAQTIDGVALNTVGQRVLLTGQTTASQNGLWVVQSGAWTRPADFATGSSAAQSYVPITGGSWAGGSYFCTSSVGSDVVDTNSLTWTVFSQPVSVTAGAGLTKTGTTLDVVANADGTIIVNADDVQVGTLLTSNLGANIVTNAKFRKSAGLSVVGNSGATLSDVADITGANNTALRVSSGVLGFGTLDLSTALFVGTLPTARQAAQAHGSLTGLSGDDHTQYIRVDGTRAFTGDQSFGAHAATNLSYAGLGTTAIGAGLLRMSPNGATQVQLMTTLASDGVTVVSLFRWTQSSNQLRVGDGSTDYVKALFKAGGTGFIISGAADEYLFNETGADWNFNSLNKVGYVDFYDGTHPVSGTGLLRAATAAGTLIATRNADNSGNASLMAVAGNSTTYQDFYVGNSSAKGANAFYSDAASFFQWNVAGTPKLGLTSSALDLKQNAVANAGYIDFYDGVNAVPGSGYIRAPYNVATIIKSKDAGGTDRDVLRVRSSANPEVTLGDTSAYDVWAHIKATSGSFGIWDGTTQLLKVTPTGASLGVDLSMGTHGITHGASPASVGADRWSHGNFSAGKSNGGSDRNLVSWGIDGTDWLTFGHPLNATNLYTTGGSHIFNVASTTKLSFDANKLFVGTTGAAPTSNPAGGIYMWVAAAESLRTRSDAGVEEHLTHLNGGGIYGTTKQIIRRESGVTTSNGSRTVADTFTLPDNTVALCKATVIGWNTTSAQVAGYTLERTVYRRGAGAVALGVSDLPPNAWESNSAWDASFDVLSNDVRINVLGAASQTIVWWVRWEITLFTP